MNRVRRVSPEKFSVRKGTLLWDYNFHYFDGLLAREPDGPSRRAWVETWLSHVEPGSRPAWDPYPVSRRICNWIKWVLTEEPDPPRGFVDSLAAQATYLEGHLEFDLMANHLLANATALTMAGIFFGGEGGERWLRRGTRLLARELPEQFPPDGGHFESSPVYHSLILEDLLDLIQVARVKGVSLPDSVRAAAGRAAGWLSEVVRPDGRLPLFGDAAYGIARAPSHLLGYAEDLGIIARQARVPGVRVLENSGYSRYDYGRLSLVADVGDFGPSYQPGHAHCDMLSFELSWDGVPLIVDTGTSTYELGERRLVERGTAAHNTVQVGGREQSEIWASFRVARRARLVTRTVDGDQVTGSIRAFPPRWVEHHRTWEFKGESLTVTDRVGATRPTDRPITARLHFHPDVRLVRVGSSWFANDLGIRFEGACAIRETPYRYAPEFNRLIPARCLEIDFEGHLRTYFSP